MPRVRLNGQVVSNDYAQIYRYFGYEVCCPNDLRAAIENCPDDEELVIEINSSGGSVYAGFEMYNIVRNSGKKCKAEIYSIAGSAMSVIMAGCGEVRMSPVSNMMIHRSSAYVNGNAQSLKQRAQMLDTIDESVLNAYEEKAGSKTSRTKLKHMMENETFLTAQEAVNVGLADGLIEKPSEDSNGTDPISAVASAGINSLSSTMILAGMALPPIEDLQKLLKEQGTLNNGEPEGEEPEEDPGQNIKNEEAEESENEMSEINTVDELLAAYPELGQQIQNNAAEAERNRINAIDAVALPGYENIVAAAKADPTQNAGSVAMAIIAEQKKQGSSYIASAESDAEESGTNDVPAEVEGRGLEENPEAEIGADAKAAVENFYKNGGVK